MDLPPPSIESLPPPTSNPAPAQAKQMPPPLPKAAVAAAEVSAKKPKPELVAQDHSTWRGILADVVTYPVRKDGLFILLPGALLGLALAIGVLAPILGLVALVSMTYFGAYYLSVIEQTAGGRDSPPDWPEISGFMDDIVKPVLLLVAAILVAALPELVYAMQVPEDDRSTFVLLLCYVWFHGYLPMALLSAAIHGTFISVLPHYVLPAIFRIWRGYAVVALLVQAGYLLAAFAVGLGSAVPFVSLFVVAVVAFYAIICQGRLIGLIYLRYQGRLGW